MTSTYDSAESIATLPPESDLDDEQIRTMLASPLSRKCKEARSEGEYGETRCAVFKQK